MSAARFPDWQARYGAYIESRRRMRFAWGPNDCCTFAGDCVLAVTGIDPGAEHRGYSTEKEAARKLQELGGVGGVGDRLFGAVVPPLMARVGDVGLVTIDGRESLAVCNGDTWLGPGAEGLVAQPLDAASRAWRF